MTDNKTPEIPKEIIGSPKYSDIIEASHDKDIILGHIRNSPGTLGHQMQFAAQWISSLQSEITQLKADKEKIFQSAEYWTGKFEEARKEAAEYRKALEDWQQLDARNPGCVLAIAGNHLATRNLLLKYPNGDKQ